MKVKVYQLFQVSANNLIGVHKDDFLEIHWKENIEKQNFVCPDDSLFFLLSAEPGGPFVCHEFVLEIISFGQVRDKFLKDLSEKPRYWCLRTRKEGDKKFSMNQNLTVLFVFRKTLSIMIATNR